MTANTFADGAEIWNKRFAGEQYLFGREPNEFLRAKAGQLRAGGRVLCVADGEGRNSVWLARQGLQVDAFDLAEVGVAKAQRLAESQGVSVNYEISACDARDWQPAAYDGVVAIFVQFAEPVMRQRMFANIVQSLKPGGILLLQGYGPKQLDYKTGGPGVLSHLYTAELLRAELAALDIIELTEYDAELSEGARHSGISALVGMVARRR
jgi:SAM-dependent methyltransferase